MTARLHSHQNMMDSRPRFFHSFKTSKREEEHARYPTVESLLVKKDLGECVKFR